MGIDLIAGRQSAGKPTFGRALCIRFGGRCVRRDVPGGKIRDSRRASGIASSTDAQKSHRGFMRTVGIISQPEKRARAPEAGAPEKVCMNALASVKHQIKSAG
jgi:hypothetical protein